MTYRMIPVPADIERHIIHMVGRQEVACTSADGYHEWTAQMPEDSPQFTTLELDWVIPSHINRQLWAELTGAVTQL